MGVGVRDELLLTKGDQGSSISLCLPQRDLKSKSNTTTFCVFPSLFLLVADFLLFGGACVKASIVGILCVAQ
jgi:hypothetical protein